MSNILTFSQNNLSLYTSEILVNVLMVSASTVAGGAVSSVNSKVGVVVLNPDDLDDTSTTNKFTTQAEIDKLLGIEAGAQVNPDDSEIVTSINNDLGGSSWQTDTNTQLSQGQVVSYFNAELSYNAIAGFLGFDSANANWRGIKGDVSGALSLYPVNAGRVLINNSTLCISSGVKVAWSNAGSVGASAFPTTDTQLVRKAAGVIETDEVFLRSENMTTTERDALTGLSGGELIFNETLSKHQGYDGTSWNDLY